MLHRYTRSLLLWLMCLVLAVPPWGGSGTAWAQPAHAPTLNLTFPTVAGASFSDDYADLRGGGRAHRATDVFATVGSPVYAAVGGTVSWLPGHHPSAGFAIHIRGTDGRTYAYYHLGSHGGPAARAYAPGIREGATVQRGQVIGYLGDSGSALGTPAHLHFEIHQPGVPDPYGTNRLNPYPSLVAAVRRDDYASRGEGDTARSGRTSLLRLGDRGADVADWQRLLTSAGATGIAADGAFGPLTEAATRAFQQSHGLTPDGIVGPQTRAAMATLSDGNLLRRGDRGAQVADWQRLLARASGIGITADGLFGPLTEAATRAFQRAQGLAADGIVGPQTRLAAAGLLTAAPAAP